MIGKLPTPTLHAGQTQRISGKLFRINKVNLTNAFIKILDNVDILICFHVSWTVSLRFVFDAVTDILIKKNLEECGL